MLSTSLIEARRQETQAALDLTKSAAERNRLGQFATPQSLALQIAHYVKTLFPEDLAIHFADPSIGSGSFFSAVVSTFGRHRIQTATGIEIDEKFFTLAHELWHQLGLHAIRADFTQLISSANRPPAPNLILANPPYVRHHHLPRSEKERLQSLVRLLTGIDVNGLAGLYVYFLLLATEWLADEGLAAWLIPSEFMDVNYGAALKTFLTEKVALIHIHRFSPDDVQFGDALVSSAVVIFQKKMPTHAHNVLFTLGGSLRDPQASANVPLSSLRLARKWSLFPATESNDRHSLEANHGPTLGDLVRIQRGIATGSNDFFIIPRADAQRHRLPNEYLHPVLSSPRFLKETVIESDYDGYPRLEPQLCLIDCDLPEVILERKYPAFWDYLQRAEALGIKSGYLVSKRDPWYKQEQREPAPFLCTYMGRGSHDKRPFRFIWNKSDAICTNLYLMIYPKSKLRAMFSRHPQRMADFYAILCQSAPHELRGEGRVYGGGLHKIEPSELSRISASAITERWPELASTPSPQTLNLFH